MKGVRRDKSRIQNFISFPLGSVAHALGVDVIFGEDDHHRSAADFAIVVHFGGHFIGVRNGDFKDFETSRAGDFSKFHALNVEFKS